MQVLVRGTSSINSWAAAAVGQASDLSCMDDEAAPCALHPCTSTSHSAHTRQADFLKIEVKLCYCLA